MEHAPFRLPIFTLNHPLTETIISGEVVFTTVPLLAPSFFGAASGMNEIRCRITEDLTL